MSLADITALLSRARACDPEAVEGLVRLVEAAAAHPDRRVGAALGLGRRGGVSMGRAALIAEQDGALRELARIIAPGQPIERQARAVAARLRRYRPSPMDAEGGNGQQALHRISGTGLPAPSIRHLRRILSRL